MKIKSFFPALFFTIFVYSIVLFFYYDASQNSAINQAQIRTQDLLRHIKAGRKFFREDQRDTLKKIAHMDTYKKDIFLPEIYSYPYISTQMNVYYNELRQKENLPAINISFAAINPKNIINKATEEEIKLIEKFNSGKLNFYKKVIDTEKGKYLYFAQPADRMDEKCLKCHGYPKDAPRSIIKMYGNQQGFYHKNGELNAFVKVLLPLDKYFEEAQKLFWTIAISSFIILIVIMVLLRLFVTKKRKDSKKFQTVIDTLDEMILVKSNCDIQSVNKSLRKFFGIKNISEFKKRNKCLSHYFIEAKGHLSLDLTNITDNLIETLKNTEKTKRVVQMKNYKGEICTLAIKIDKLEDEDNQHVIVLSDITKLQQRAEKFKKRANIDALTGVYGRSKFDELYHSEFSRSTRYLNPLTIIFIDIDHFKIINDTHGHDVGDEILKVFAKLISSNRREFDIFARWGGEEFILMLPQTNINDGYKLGEKIRKTIASYEFDKAASLTCSIGLSMLNKGDTKETLIKRADNALYKAKTTGRNKTIIEI